MKIIRCPAGYYWKKTMRQLDAAARSACAQAKAIGQNILTVGAAEITPPEHLQKALTNTNTPEEWQEIIA
ncbi:MAG: hypothetical protein U1E36_02450 [Rickettsiales bacterium]